jgi:hypothetical protein
MASIGGASEAVSTTVEEEKGDVSFRLGRLVSTRISKL